MATDVEFVAQSVGGAATDEEALQTSLALIRAVLDQGLMDVGDVTDGGFFEWGLDQEQAMERIEREWRQLDRPLNLGDVCWLANTGAGDRRAEAVRNAIPGESS